MARNRGWGRSSILFVNQFLAAVRSHPDGYTGRCPAEFGSASGIPAHGLATLQGSGVFRLALSHDGGAPVTVYNAAETAPYALTLSGGTFRGFVIASMAGDSVGPSFEGARRGLLAPADDATSQSMGDCEGLTHINNAARTSQNFSWTPSPPGGAVTFWAVVVTSYHGFNYQVKLTLQDSTFVGSATASPGIPTPSRSGSPSASASASTGGNAPMEVVVRTKVLRANHPIVTLSWGLAPSDSSVASFTMTSEGSTFLAFALGPGMMINDGSSTGTGSSPCVIGTLSGSGSGRTRALSVVTDSGTVRPIDASSSTEASDVVRALQTDGGTPATGSVGLFLLKGKSEDSIIRVSPELTSAGLIDGSASVAYNGSHTVMTWSRPLAAAGDVSERLIIPGAETAFIWATGQASDDTSGTLAFHGPSCGSDSFVMPLATSSDGGQQQSGSSGSSGSSSPPPPVHGWRSEEFNSPLGGAITFSWRMPSAIVAAAVSPTAGAGVTNTSGNGGSSRTDVMILAKIVYTGPRDTGFAVGINDRTPDMFGASAVVVSGATGSQTLQQRYLTGHSLGFLRGAPATASNVSIVPSADGGSVTVSFIWSGVSASGTYMVSGTSQPASHMLAKLRSKSIYTRRSLPLKHFHVYPSKIVTKFHSVIDRSQIWATGSPGQASLTQHSNDNRGAEAVVFATGQTSAVSDATYRLRIAHAVLMSSGWLALILGIMAARYTRDLQPKTTWFRLHRWMQSIGLLLVVCGFGLAVAMTSGPHFQSRHAQLGLVIAAIALLQPVNAFFRPHPHPLNLRRRLWSVGHKAAGYATAACAVACIGLGIPLITRGMTSVMTILGYAILAVCCAVLAMVVLVLEIFLCDRRWQSRKEALSASAATAAAAAGAAQPNAVKQSLTEDLSVADGDISSSSSNGSTARPLVQIEGNESASNSTTTDSNGHHRSPQQGGAGSTAAATAAAPSQSLLEGASAPTRSPGLTTSRAPAAAAASQAQVPSSGPGHKEAEHPRGLSGS